MVEAVSGGDSGPERLHDDVGSRRQRLHVGEVARLAEVELGATLAARPHTRTGRRLERIVTGRLHPRDPGPVVGEQHRADRSGHAPGEIEYIDPVKDTARLRFGHWPPNP
ncbi:unannotated protein [freshwater metagenome]|uniref:Unannotated protein n=1 Tax=freshwater metagenome TaxID=449393 RepID=A0A6J6TNW9_9ZZZZ